MLFDRVTRGPVEAAARTGRELLLGELERSVDAIAASDLPEHLARTIVDERLVERMLAAIPADELVDRLVATGALDRIVDEIVASPVFRNAVERRGSDAAAALRRRCATWDDAAEAHVRRWTHRPDVHRDTGYAGVVTRGVALVADAATVHALFIAAVGSVALVVSVLHVGVDTTIAATALSVAWIALVGAYFAGSWAVVGATPGMRLLGIRVVDGRGRVPSPARALARALWLVIAVAPVLVGFVPAFFDGRRRALQDLIAGTAVVRDVSAP